MYTHTHLPSLQQRREEHERHIREQEEELLQQEMEFKERQRRQTEEEEERRKADAEQKHSSANAQFEYNANYPDYEFERPVQSPDSMQESDSSISVLSPVPGSTIWEAVIDEIDLVKGEEGLGFSILDFVVSSLSLAYVPSKEYLRSHTYMVPYKVSLKGIFSYIYRRNLVLFGIKFSLYI